MLQQCHADSPVLGDHPGAAGGKVTRGRRGRQADAGHRNAAGGRARQAHAAAADGLQQTRFLRRGQPRRDHHQRPDAAVPALPGHLHDLRRRHRHYRQVGRLRQRGDRPDAADSLELTTLRADRVHPSGETGVADVAQDDPAGRGRIAAHANHRDRRRVQQWLQAGHSGLPVPTGHGVQIGAGLAEGRVARDRHGQLHHAVVILAPHRQPGVAEQVQDGVVVRQHLGGERRHATDPGHRDQVLKQQRGDTAAVHAIGDRQRDLRSRLAGTELVAGHSHQLVVAEQAEQRHPARTIVQADPPGLPLGRDPARAEETEVQVVRRHRLVQPPDDLVIPRTRRPDGQRGPVGQQRIGPPRRLNRKPGQRRIDRAATPDTSDPMAQPSTRLMIAVATF